MNYQNASWHHRGYIPIVSRVQRLVQEPRPVKAENIIKTGNYKLPAQKTVVINVVDHHILANTYRLGVRG